MSTNNLIAIIRNVSPNDIVDVAGILLDVGINRMEVSLSDEANGLACIEKIAKAFGDQIELGVGTICKESQVDIALEAGATYIITPGWDRELVKYVLDKGVQIYPGVFTPGEIMQASALGVETVKLFPAASLGTEYIKSLRGPFPNMKIMAVGGVTQDNIQAFQKAGCSSFAIGSDLIPKGASLKDKETIMAKAKQYIQLLSEES